MSTLTAPSFRKITAPTWPGKEAADWGTDPGSGSAVVRLTSGAVMSLNIYCEQPYASPEGRRFLIARLMDSFMPQRQLVVADLQTYATTLIEPDVPTEMVAHVPWGEWAYYLMNDGSIRRLSLVTLEREEVLPAGTLAPASAFTIQTITADERWILGDERLPGRSHARTFAIDTRTGEQRTVYDAPDNLNSHVQVDRSDRQRMLMQRLVRGPVTRVSVHTRELFDGPDTLLPVGGDWSAESSGHMAWIGTTGKVAVAVQWNREERQHDSRHPEGNLLVAGPGDTRPTIFPAPRHAFYHVSVSRCGRYFVGDDFMDWKADGFNPSGPRSGPIRIVVGNLQTGKSRVLIGDCQNHGIAGSSRFEPDPYFTADNQWVIYNAAPWGIMQVFAARVPEAFLKSLD